MENRLFFVRESALEVIEKNVNEHHCSVQLFIFHKDYVPDEEKVSIGDEKLVQVEIKRKEKSV